MAWRKLRVMISSTISDLTKERDAVDTAIRHFEFERFRSEAMSSLSRSPREVCEDMARDCDLQILIIGCRYGWIIPDLGISVTEREFNVAREADSGKVLVFTQASSPHQRESKEKAFLKKVTDFTTGLYRAASFCSASELGNQVRSAISAWISNRILEGRLSQRNVLSLPHPSDNWGATGILFFLLITLVIFSSIFTALGLPSHSNPSLTHVVQTLVAQGSEVIPALKKTCMYSVVALVSGFVLGGCIGLLCVVSSRRFSSLFLRWGTWSLAIACVYAVLFGDLIFGVSAYNFGAILAVATGTIMIFKRTANSLQEHPVDRTQWSRVKHLAINSILDPALPTLTYWAAGGVFFSELMFGVSGIGRLFMESRYMLNIPIGYTGVLAFAVILVFTHIQLRSLQGYIGWNWIVWPRLTSSQKAGGLVRHHKQKPNIHFNQDKTASRF